MFSDSQIFAESDVFDASNDEQWRVSVQVEHMEEKENNVIHDP
jgi:hypothetical protein